MSPVLSFVEPPASQLVYQSAVTIPVCVWTIGETRRHVIPSFVLHVADEEQRHNMVNNKTQGRTEIGPYRPLGVCIRNSDRLVSPFRYPPDLVDDR